MPLVKVPVFTSHHHNHNSSEPPKRQNISGMQKFYRTSTENSANKKSPPNPNKKNSIGNTNADETANVKLNPGTVHKFLSQINVVHTTSKDKKKPISKPKNKKEFDGHVYENIDIENVTNASNLILKNDVTVKENSVKSTNNRENVTVISVGSKSENSECFSDKTNLKLAKALETFDRLLSEFSLPTESSCDHFVPPKLKKAKTCSIIESRCILKKYPFEFESVKKVDNSCRKELKRPPLNKTKSLWNLNDMDDVQFNSKIPIFMPASNKFNTYKITGKDIGNVIDPTPLKSSELSKLDVKTRILKKTFSNPPSTPVPVVGKTTNKKVERKTSDPNKKLKSTRANNQAPSSKPITLTKSKTSDQIEAPKNKLQKARSIWEVSKSSSTAQSNRSLARTKSNASLAGSTSKIPVVRNHNVPNKFSSTRALFSPTPDDLKLLDHSKDSGVGSKRSVKESSEKVDKRFSTRKIDTKTFRVSDKNRTNDSKNDCNEIVKVRAKIQQKKLSIKNDISVLESKVKSEPIMVDGSYSPVKTIINKMEMHCAVEGQVEPIPYQNCKIISPLQRTIGVANISTQNNFNKINKKPPQTPIEAKNDTEVCKLDPKIELANRKLSLASTKSFASSDEKIYEDHSDCSDDSGHVSNESEPIAKIRVGKRNLTVVESKDNLKASEISIPSPTYVTNNMFASKNSTANNYDVHNQNCSFKTDSDKPDLLSDLSAPKIALETRDSIVPVPAERRSTHLNQDIEVILSMFNLRNERTINPHHIIISTITYALKKLKRSSHVTRVKGNSAKVREYNECDRHISTVRFSLPNQKSVTLSRINNMANIKAYGL